MHTALETETRKDYLEHDDLVAIPLSNALANINAPNLADVAGQLHAVRPVMWQTLLYAKEQGLFDNPVLRGGQ